MNPFRRRQDPYAGLSKKRTTVVNTKLQNPYTAEGLNAMYKWKPGQQSVPNTTPLSSQTFRNVENYKLKNPYTAETLQQLHGTGPIQMLGETELGSLNQSKNLYKGSGMKPLQAKAATSSTKWNPVQTPSTAKGIPGMKSGYQQGAVKLPGLTSTKLPNPVKIPSTIRQPITNTKPALSSKPTSSFAYSLGGLAAGIAGQALKQSLEQYRINPNSDVWRGFDLAGNIVSTGLYTVNPYLGAIAAPIIEGIGHIATNAAKNNIFEGNIGMSTEDQNLFPVYGKFLSEHPNRSVTFDEWKKWYLTQQPTTEAAQGVSGSAEGGTCELMTEAQVRMLTNPEIQKSDKVMGGKGPSTGPASDNLPGTEHAPMTTQDQQNLNTFNQQGISFGGV